MEFNFSNALRNAENYWTQFFVPHEKMFVLYLFTSFFLAWVIWWIEAKNQTSKPKQRDFFSYVFNSNIYNHKSSWQDYFIFLINGLLYYGLIAQFVLSEKSVSVFTVHALQTVFGLPNHPILVGITATALFTLQSAILFDLSVYASHYLFHKIPALWAFHKVHHSAEVMTPITLLRLHPLEILVNSLAYAIFIGFGIGLFAYLTMRGVTDVRIFGVNIVVFATLLVGVHLRHMHIWLHYPKWLSCFLISPAQHQIHHSTAQHHFDKNLGLIFSFWDKMFGTLYLPQARERIQFGINKRTPNPYASVKAVYLQPFKDSIGSM